MSLSVALLDANVLYPAPLRDILLQLAVADLFRARWSDEISNEWIESLLKSEPHRQRSALEHTRDLMNQRTRDSLVIDYEHLIPSLILPDPDDRHVLAAAIAGGCDVVVTHNLKDFPESVLADYEIIVMPPDEFLCYHFDQVPQRFCEEVRKIRARLKNPPYSVDEYLDTLSRQKLPTLVEKLRQSGELI